MVEAGSSAVVGDGASGGRRWLRQCRGHGVGRRAGMQSTQMLSESCADVLVETVCFGNSRCANCRHDRLHQPPSLPRQARGSVFATPPPTKPSPPPSPKAAAAKLLERAERAAAAPAGVELGGKQSACQPEPSGSESGASQAQIASAAAFLSGAYAATPVALCAATAASRDREVGHASEGPSSAGAFADGRSSAGAFADGPSAEN